MSASAIANIERTLKDVIQTMQTGFGRLTADMIEVKDNLHELNRRVGNLEVKVCDMDENLLALTEAFDKDTVRLMDHERRITRLERGATA